MRFGRVRSLAYSIYEPFSVLKRYDTRDICLLNASDSYLAWTNLQSRLLYNLLDLVRKRFCSDRKERYHITRL